MIHLLTAGWLDCSPQLLLLQVHQEQGHPFTVEQLQEDGPDIVHCHVYVQLKSELIHDCHSLQGQGRCCVSWRKSMAA